MDGDINNQGGLTNREHEIMEHLVSAWNLFQEIHPSYGELQEISNGLHKCQDVLGQRVLARDYPEYWGNEEQNK